METIYRGERYAGEWYIEDGVLYLISPYGAMSGPAVTLSFPSTSPAGIAKGMLWRLMRAKDPKPPFFYWR